MSRMLPEMRLSTYVFLDKAVEKGVLSEYKTIPNEKCCGFGSVGVGDEENAQKCVDYNVGWLNRFGIKDVLFTCGACTAYMGGNKEFLKRGFRPLNIMEYSYALIKSGEMDKLIDRRLDSSVKITGHYSCHLRRTAGVNIEEIYRTISEYLGATYVEMDKATTCCGAGSEGQVMAAIAERKVLEAAKTDADVCPLGCAGCESLLKQVGTQKGIKTKFISLTSLLASCFSDMEKYVEKYEPKKQEIPTGQKGQETEPGTTNPEPNSSQAETQKQL
jgi:Fe-S oxidoreductase